MFNAKYTTTGAEEPDEEQSSLLYPNPATGEVTIEADNYMVESVRMFDMQ